MNACASRAGGLFDSVKGAGRGFSTKIQLLTDLGHDISW